MSKKFDKVPFEDALSQTGFGRFNIFFVLLCSSIMAGMAFEAYSVSYLVPASACELNTTSTQQGLMAGMPLLGILATSHFWGYFADTRGRKKILTLSLILGFTTGALAAFSPNWIVFCLLKLLSSSSVSGTMALVFTLLSECTPESKRNVTLILTNSSFFLSTAVMAVIAIPVLPLKFSYYIPYLDIHFNSWRLLDIIYSLPCAIGAIGMIFAFESPKYLLSMGKEEESLEVLKSIYAINSRKNHDYYKVQSIMLEEDSAPNAKGIWSSIKAQTLPLMKPPLLKNTLLISALYVAVYFCINPFTVWLPHIADEFMRAVEHGQSSISFCEMLRSSRNITVEQTNDCSMNKFAMTMVFAVDMLLTLFNTMISSFSCCGRKTLFISIQLVAGIAGMCINYSKNWIFSAVLFVSFFGGVINFTLLSAYSVDTFPTYLKAMAVCVTVMVGRTSAVFGVNLLKNLLVTNCEAAFYLFPAIALSGGVLGLLLPSQKKKQTTKSDSQI